MLRRMCVSLAALALAAAPALTLMVTSSTAEASPARAAAHLTATHGSVRTVGAATHRAQPGGRPLGRQHGGLFNSTSTNWSGYAATGSAFTTVSATWVQPAGSCTSATRYSSFWVGLDGYASNSVEQTGTDTDCSSG